MNPIMKSLRVIGDLDHEFYDDERQREVWNEASAVGLQCALWLAVLAAAITAWVAGRTGGWVAMGLLVGAGIVSVIVTSYSRACRVDAYTTSNLWRVRSTVYLVFYLAAVWGTATHLYFSGRPTAELVSGLLGGFVGVAVSAAALTVSIRRKRRKEAELEAAEEF